MIESSVRQRPSLNGLKTAPITAPSVSQGVQIPEELITVSRAIVLTYFFFWVFSYRVGVLRRAALSGAGGSGKMGFKSPEI